MLTPRRRLLGAAVAGLALSAAFEPLALAWLVPLSVGAFALVMRGQTPRRAFLLGLVGGLFPAIRAARLPVTAALREA